MSQTTFSIRCFLLPTLTVTIHPSRQSSSAPTGSTTPWPRPSSTPLREVSAVFFTTSPVRTLRMLEECRDIVRHWYFSCVPLRNLQSFDSGSVHPDLLLPGLLDLRPGRVRWGLHPVAAHWCGLGAAVWNIARQPHSHWIGLWNSSSICFSFWKALYLLISFDFTSVAVTMTH